LRVLRKRERKTREKRERLTVCELSLLVSLLRSDPPAVDLH